MDNDTYIPQYYKRIDKISFEDCYFFYVPERNIWDNFDKLIKNWEEEDKEKNKK